MEFPKSIELSHLLVSFMDIDNFTAIGKKLGALDLFKLMDGATKLVQKSIDEAEGRLIKVIGDDFLTVFPEDRVDDGVRTLRKLKDELEAYLSAAGCATTVHLSMHFGEVALGFLGGLPDVYGETVNTAATLFTGKHRGKMILSPQVFRKLLPETRKSFHKFTPPYVYLAE